MIVLRPLNDVYITSHLIHRCTLWHLLAAQSMDLFALTKGDYFQSTRFKAEVKKQIVALKGSILEKINLLSDPQCFTELLLSSSRYFIFFLLSYMTGNQGAVFEIIKEYGEGASCSLISLLCTRVKV